jgi:response regulator RpfG family c-di-GMP phosphodiesterase
VRQLARQVSPRLLWRAELAALLSQVGCAGISEETLNKVYAGKQVPAKEAALYREHPKVGSDLLKHVPRLEAVAEILLRQEKHFDGSGFPEDDMNGEAIPVEARILKVALDLDSLTLAGSKFPEAIAEMRARVGTYDTAVLDAAGRLESAKETAALSA